jgi:hypothetical protein
MSQNTPSQSYARYQHDVDRALRPLQAQLSTLAPRTEMSPPATQIPNPPSRRTIPGGTRPSRTDDEVDKAKRSCQTCEFESGVNGVAPYCYNPNPAVQTCRRWAPVDAPAVPQTSQGPYASPLQTQPVGTMQAIQYAGDARLYNPSVGSAPPVSLFQFQQGAPPLTGLSQSPQGKEVDDPFIIALSGGKWKQSWTDLQSSGGNGT